MGPKGNPIGAKVILEKVLEKLVQPTNNAIGKELTGQK